MTVRAHVDADYRELVELYGGNVARAIVEQQEEEMGKAKKLFLKLSDGVGNCGDFPEVSIDRVRDSNPDCGERIELTQWWAGKENTVWIPVSSLRKFIRALEVRS